ncbi:uncharacterized protein LOC144903011 isoform X2 [Branchiostoma floridae x Branchiostoma belcheri]
MWSKKLSPNGKAAPEGSVGRHGNRWTNGIVLALSGLAAVVSFVALLFLVQEINSIRDQQMAFMKQQEDLRKELQGLKDQLLLVQFKQENDDKDKGPASSTEDWQRDHSATFWKNAKVHRRSKRNSEANTVLILGKRSDFGCLSGAPARDGPPQVTTPAATRPPPTECYEETGDTYRGTASTTISGKVCQAWSSQSPQQHGFDPAAYPNLDLDSNYCRNPDLSTRPWCHTTDPKKQRDFCIIPKCTGLASRSEYVGCYKDTSSRTFPAGRIQNYKNMTNALCINHCAGQGYTYAVTQYSHECSCGDEANFAQLEPKRPEHECNFNCSGNREEMCGGSWRNSVYKLPEKASSDGYSCGDGLKKFQGRCYKAFTEKKSNAEAKSECSSMGGRLAAPKTPEVHGFLLDLAKMEIGNGQDVWIGIQKEDVWKFSDGGALGECSYSNWAPGEPTNNAQTKCAQYWAGIGYKWDDTYCTSTKAFICQTGPATCPDGYGKYGDTCYKLFTEKRSYRLAHATCVNDGGRLAAPKTAGTNDHLISLAKTAGGGNMWIGVDNLNTGVYKYSDGTPLKSCEYTNWAPNEPNGADCVQFWAGRGYKWDDTNCYHEQMFVCQIGPGEDAGCC